MPDAKRFDSIFRPDLFAGQVILVTGGGSGIGRCIAHELASLGAKVVIAGRNEEPLRAVVDEIGEAGGKAALVTLNIRDDEAVVGLVALRLSALLADFALGALARFGVVLRTRDLDVDAFNRRR